MRVSVEGLGFRVEGLGFTVEGLGPPYSHWQSRVRRLLLELVRAASIQ